MKLHFIRFVILFGILIVLLSFIYNSIGNSLLKNEVESITFNYLDQDNMLLTEIIIFNPSSFMVPVRELNLKITRGNETLFEETLTNFRLALEDTTINIRTPLDISELEDIMIQGTLFITIPFVNTQTIEFSETYLE